MRLVSKISQSSKTQLRFSNSSPLKQPLLSRYEKEISIPTWQIEPPHWLRTPRPKISYLLEFSSKPSASRPSSSTVHLETPNLQISTPLERGSNLVRLQLV